MNPQERAGLARKCKGAGIRIAEQSAPIGCQAVWPAIGPRKPSSPDDPPGASVQRIDIAFERLHVDASVQHERRRRVNAGEGREIREAKAPATRSRRTEAASIGPPTLRLEAMSPPGSGHPPALRRASHAARQTHTNTAPATAHQRNTAVFNELASLHS